MLLNKLAKITYEEGKKYLKNVGEFWFGLSIFRKELEIFVVKFVNVFLFCTIFVKIF